MTYINTLTALADPNRRAIVEILGPGPRNVSDLASNLTISRPAVSQHLKILCDAGLLSVNQVGTRRHYSLQPDGVDQLRAYLDGLWGDALGAFARHVEQENQK